jgi:hypothetical protein
MLSSHRELDSLITAGFGEEVNFETCLPLIAVMRNHLHDLLLRTAKHRELDSLTVSRLGFNLSRHLPSSVIKMESIYEQHVWDNNAHIWATYMIERE